ncbi:MAG: nucleotidyl transferase AbiEii/AbiGii toxin family protein [Thermoanaerobaculia bacterium]
MSRRGAVTRVLRDLAAAMHEQRLRWYLFGAQAAIVWGSPRLSADVDVTADIEPSALHDSIHALGRHGFDMVATDPDFVARTRVLPFLHRASRMPLDVVLAGPGLEDEFLQRAISIDVDGTFIPVISPEDLIVTKVLAGRPKDIEDIRGVLHERRASLDLERIRTVLGLLERALGQSDLLPLFEGELLEEPDKMGARKTGKKSNAKPRKK